MIEDVIKGQNSMWKSYAFNKRIKKMWLAYIFFIKYMSGKPVVPHGHSTIPLQGASTPPEEFQKSSDVSFHNKHVFNLLESIPTTF